MRMDRYEEEEKTNDTKQTRTNKNQELYTDVYLNNVYVDINNLKEVMERENFEEDNKQETLKVVKETLPTTNPYQEKKYDIVSIIDEAIKNKKDDNLKRNLDIENINSLEIDSIIESINESQKEEEKELKNDNLLTDLMPNDDNTTVIAPLEEPILDASLIADFENKKEEEISHDMLDDDITEKDFVEDDSFQEKKKSKIKIVLIIFSILIVIAIVVGILLFRDII